MKNRISAFLLLLLFSLQALALPLAEQVVIVSRGGVSVTFADVDDYMAKIPESKRAGVLNSPMRIQAILQDLLLSKQLAKQAVALKLDADPALTGKTGWERTQALAALRMQRFMSDMKLPDFDALAHEEYLAYPDKYSIPGRVDIQRIVIRAAGIRSEKDAWDLASQIRADAVAAPDRFAELVQQKSEQEDKDKDQGISTDVLAGKADKHVADAVAQLHNVGDISAVFRTPKRTYTIIKLLRRDPATLKPFDEVKDQIVSGLKANFVEARRRDFVDNLGNEKLDANPDAVASLRTRYLPAGAKLPAETPDSAKPAAAEPKAR